MRRLILAALIVLLPAAALSAPPPGPKRTGPHVVDPARREKIMEKIDTLRVAKLTDELELDSQTAEKLFPVLRPFQERRREAMRTRMESMRVVKEQLDAEKPDEKVVAGELDKMAEAQKALHDVAEEEYAALKPVLDPIRLAKYYRFQLKFEARVGEMIRDIKSGEGGGGGPFRERLRDRAAPEPR